MNSVTCKCPDLMVAGEVVSGGLGIRAGLCKRDEPLTPGVVSALGQVREAPPSTLSKPSAQEGARWGVSCRGCHRGE